MPITINEIVQYIRESVEKEHIKVVILDNIKLIQYDKNQINFGISSYNLLTSYVI